MKKILKYFSVILLAAGFFSCSDIATNENEAVETQAVVKGTATVKMFVPDYYAMSNATARVVAPQTTSVKFGYKDGEDFTYLDAVELSTAKATEIDGATNAGLSGKTYEFSFSGVPTGSYTKGDLKVQLLDAQGNVISEGTNSKSVTVTASSSVSASFYTIPTASDVTESSLAANEMKFLKVDLESMTPYSVTVEIGKDDTSYPDFVIFNSDGTFNKYVSIDKAEDAKYSFDKVTSKTSYYVGVYADDDKAVSSYKLKFNEVLLTELSENFEGDVNPGLSGSGISFGVANDEVLKDWVQYGKALVDTHKKVYKLSTVKYSGTKASGVGSSSLIIQKISPAVESAISFDFKLDLYPSAAEFKVLVDGKAQKIYVDGESIGTSTSSSKTIWRKGSVILAAGSHKVEFKVDSENSYSPSLKNAVYLDNISLAPNTTESVDISPKGVQETYIGGFNIPFTAKALRSDGSVINGKTATWDGAASGTFKPSSTGTFTVTATIDGKSASNETVKVHSADYLSDSVTLSGKTFTGQITNTSGSRSNTKNITWADPTPNGSSFSADGFFILKGNAKGTNGYIKITKGDYVTYYFLPKGDFYQRIWLRFGSGRYTVFVSEMDISYNDCGSYQGDISSMGSFYTSGPTTCTMTVTNTNDTVSETAAMYLLPSYWCQSDDFRITNAVNDVIANLPDDATDGQKLAALHDWEIHRMYYDYDSFNGPRKAQDALHVLEYGMGVCEGYANLFTALERVIGIRGTIICEKYNNHGWNNTFYNGSWLLVDATWDDPKESGETDKKPMSENYTYFLLTADQDKKTSKDHGSAAIMPSETATNPGDNGINNMRAIVSTENSNAPYVRGLPNGWY